jgi:polysaccharide chain length determinant protein (PEP-CTERM system associated)
MDNAPAFHPLDYVAVVRRRMWWLITPIVLALVIGAALVMLLPRKYTTTTTLGISLPSMGGQVLSDAQRLNAQERFRNLNQVLLSPAVLERVAADTGLTKRMSLEEAVGHIGANATVRLPQADPSLIGSVEQFNVEYADSDPRLTQQIANRLAEVFIEESSHKREMRAEQTSAFIADQLKASKARIDELEGRLRVAKEAFMGSLPEQTQTNVALVTGLQQQLTTASNDLRGAQEQLQWIETQISTARPTISETNEAGRPVPMTSPAATRVATLQKELASARNLYTDKHPEVVNLQRELEIARREAAAEVKLPEAQREATLREDPAYRSLLLQRDQIKLHIADLQRQQQGIQSQIGKYMARVELAPRVEQQVATLQREYDLEKQNYATLTNKLRDAQITEDVERNRGGESFAILARATLPTAPSSPNVPRLMIITVLLGVCAGGALAIGREYLDRSIHDTRALNDLELPVLGEIPRISHV